MIETGKSISYFQTEAYIKTWNIPCNCYISISENLSIPAFYNKKKLTLFMPLLEESLVDYEFVIKLMNKYSVKKIILQSCYSDIIVKVPKRLIVPKNSNLFISLPNNFEVYLSRLQTKSRYKIRAYEKKFFQIYNSSIVISRQSTEIRKDEFLDIIKLNHERMKYKGSTSSIDDTYTEKLYSLVMRFGSITMIKYNNKIIAGTICCKVESEMYLNVIGHDNGYNDYHLGYIILKKTIEQAIIDKIQFFHLLWGGIGKMTSQYKLMFGCERRFLYDVTYFKCYPDYIIEKLMFHNQFVIKLIIGTTQIYYQKINNRLRLKSNNN